VQELISRATAVRQAREARYQKKRKGDGGQASTTPWAAPPAGGHAGAGPPPSSGEAADAGAEPPPAAAQAQQQEEEAALDAEAARLSAAKFAAHAAMNKDSASETAAPTAGKGRGRATAAKRSTSH
jgi:hypothetical protein